MSNWRHSVGYRATAAAAERLRGTTPDGRLRESPYEPAHTSPDVLRRRRALRAYEDRRERDELADLGW